MKKIKSLTIIIVAAFALLASVFCAGDACAYFGSPVSHAHYSRSVRHSGYRGHGYRHHGFRGYRGHGYRHHGYRGHGYRSHRGYRGYLGCRRCHR